MLEPLTFPPPPGPPCGFGPSAEAEYDAALAATLRAAVWATPPPPPPPANGSAEGGGSGGGGGGNFPGTAGPRCVWEVLGAEEGAAWVVPLAETGFGWAGELGGHFEARGLIRGYNKARGAYKDVIQLQLAQHSVILLGPW